MEENIIKIYLKVKEKNSKMPKGTWMGSNGKENMIQIFRYITKQGRSKKYLKSLTIDFFKKNHIYVPLKKYFNGKVFDVIEYCYPGELKIYEMDNLPKNYWDDKDNIKEAFNFYVRNLSEKEIINLPKEWFYENRLSTPLGKYYRNSPYLFLLDIYKEDIQRERKFNGYWNRYIASEKLVFCEKDNEKRITVKFLKEHGLTTPLKKFFHNSPSEFWEYAKKAVDNSLN